MAFRPSITRGMALSWIFICKYAYIILYFFCQTRKLHIRIAYYNIKGLQFQGSKKFNLHRIAFYQLLRSNRSTTIYVPYLYVKAPGMI